MTNPNEFDDRDSLPPELVSRFRSRYGPMQDVPVEVDLDILADARQCLSQSRGPRNRQSRRGLSLLATGSVAAAAIVLLAAWISGRLEETSQDTLASRTALERDPTAMQDVDGNGRVDILDAFTVARDFRRGRHLPQHDLNKDGRVDVGDVDLVARLAVRL